MTLAEFFSEFETTVSLPPGTVQGQERLDSIERWDSFAAVEFMSMADQKLGVRLEPAQIAACRQVSDLAVLCGFKPQRAEIFAFTLREVPAVISRVLSAKGLSVDDVDLFVPHQANAFILADLQRKLRIPPERFVIDIADCGDTGSTIAIALRRAMARGATRAGIRVMLVGHSWGATLLEWI